MGTGTWLLLAAMLTGGGPAAQEAGPTPAAGMVNDEQLSVSLDRIRKGLDQPSRLAMPQEIPTFYVEVERELPRLEHFFSDKDLTTGPVPGAGMTHNEFLAMVTPQDLYSSAGITATDQLMVGVTSRVLQWLLTNALREMRDAATEREREAIRERVRRELEQLERARDGVAPPP